jgi:hypothetical protein
LRLKLPVIRSIERISNTDIIALNSMKESRFAHCVFIVAVLDHFAGVVAEERDFRKHGKEIAEGMTEKKSDVGQGLGVSLAAP